MTIAVALKTNDAEALPSICAANLDDTTAVKKAKAEELLWTTHDLGWMRKDTACAALGTDASALPRWRPALRGKASD